MAQHYYKYLNKNMKNIILSIVQLCLLFFSTCLYAQKDVPFGINLAGAEFFHKKIDGVGSFGKDYFYPTINDLDYWKSKGLKLIRLPFKWERLQRELLGPLNVEEIEYICFLLEEADKRDMKILLDMHNYGRRSDNGVNRIIGDSCLPASAFAEAWKMIAEKVGGYHSLYGYGLINEPHDMLDSVPWRQIAQAAINEIRKIDKKTAIVVGGNHWSSAMRWKEVSDDLKNLNDPSDNLIFEAHCYFDNDASGIYRKSYDEEGAYPNIGIDRVKPFIDWLNVNNLRGFVGEYGIPGNDIRWLECLDKFLDYISKHNVNGTYWAAGAQWNNYILSVHPEDNYSKDRVQLKVLTRYLLTGNNK